MSDLRQGGIADRVCSSAKGRTRMFIHGVYVNMIPRMAVMVSGKVSAGVQDPPCLDVGDGSFDLVLDLVDGPVAGPVVGVEG